MLVLTVSEALPTHAQDDSTDRTKMPTHVCRFEFESLAGELITDKAKQAKISIYYQPFGMEKPVYFLEDEWVAVDRRVITHGIPVPAGRYWASYKKSPHERDVFWEMHELQDNVPAVLRFRIPPPVTFRGRVVDGSNGKPLQGVFVGGYRSRTSDRNFSDVTQEEWDAASKLPNAPALDAVALKPFLRIYGFKKIVRTDKNGRFKLLEQPDDHFWGAIVFTPNHLRTSVEIFHAGRAEDLGEIPLFPAARIRMVSERRKNVSVRWSFPSENQPEWLSLYRNFVTTLNRGLVQAGTNLRQNEPRWILLPAGLRFRLEGGTSKSRSRLFRTVPEIVERFDKTVYLFEAGQELEFDKLPLEPALKVPVQIVSPDGKPVEGVEVSYLYDRGFEPTWHWGVLTDRNGLANLFLEKEDTYSLEAKNPDWLPLSLRHPIEALFQRIEVNIGNTTPKKTIQIKLTEDQMKLLPVAAPPVGDRRELRIK